MAEDDRHEQLQGQINELREWLVIVTEKLQEQTALIEDLAEIIDDANRTLTAFRMRKQPVSVANAVGSISVNGSVTIRPPVPVGNIPMATVKVEPSVVTSMVSVPSIPQMTSVPRPAHAIPSLQTPSPPPMSQEMITSSDMPDVKPVVSMPQSSSHVGALLNNLSQARLNSAALTGGSSLTLPSMGGNPIGIHMSNMISSGIASSVQPSQTVLPSGQSSITSVSGSGALAGISQPMQSAALNPFAASPPNASSNSNVGMSQPQNSIQGGVSMGQPATGMSPGNTPQMSQNGSGINPNMMANLGSTGGSSGAGTMMPTPGISQQVQPEMQSAQVSNSPANIPMSQQTSTSLPSVQSKYVKVWEGDLSGQRQGQPVFITRLEGYRNASASETLAANWPSTMQIVRLISQDHMNNKQYVGKADFLVFRAMQTHGFLTQLQEKKLDMVVFKPQISSQQQQQMQQQQMQQQQMQQQQMQQQQMQQQQLQQQQMQQQQMQQQQNQQQQPYPQLQQQQQQQLAQLQQQQLQHLQHQQQPLPQLQQQPSMQQLQQKSQMQQLQQQPQQLQQLQQQPQQLQQLQQQPQQLQQQLPQIQQLQQQPQTSQVVGPGIGQAYGQATGRSQLVPQGQVSSQGPSNMPGGGFLS